MTQTEFFEQLTIILDVDSVNAESILRDFDTWDSLSVLSVLAMVDAKYGVTVAPTELSSVRTAGELLSLVDQKVKMRG